MLPPQARNAPTCCICKPAAEQAATPLQPSAPEVVIGGGGKLMPVDRLIVDRPSLSRPPGSRPGPNVLPGAAALPAPLLSSTTRKRALQWSRLEVMSTGRAQVTPKRKHRAQTTWPTLPPPWLLPCDAPASRQAAAQLAAAAQHCCQPPRCAAAEHAAAAPPAPACSTCCRCRSPDRGSGGGEHRLSQGRLARCRLLPADGSGRGQRAAALWSPLRGALSGVASGGACRLLLQCHGTRATSRMVAGGAQRLATWRRGQRHLSRALQENQSFRAAV